MCQADSRTVQAKLGQLTALVLEHWQRQQHLSLQESNGGLTKDEASWWFSLVSSLLRASFSALILLIG